MASCAFGMAAITSFCSEGPGRAPLEARGFPWWLDPEPAATTTGVMPSTRRPPLGPSCAKGSESAFVGFSLALQTAACLPPIRPLERAQSRTPWPPDRQTSAPAQRTASRWIVIRPQHGQLSGPCSMLKSLVDPSDGLTAWEDNNAIGRSNRPNG